MRACFAAWSLLAWISVACELTTAVPRMVVNVTRQSSPWARRSLQEEKKLQLASAPPTYDPNHPDANPGPKGNNGFGTTGPQRLEWTLQKQWPKTGRPSTSSYGQITGIDIDKQGRIWVLHRGPNRQWDARSFKYNDMVTYTSPISEPTISRFAAGGGDQPELRAGQNLFMMPHMITIDSTGDVWVVDCGLHQVLKFKPDALDTPVLTIGVKLQPGHDDAHLCKPTDVAVKTDGSFFVSDGYCNSRVLYYDAAGVLKFKFGDPGQGPGQFKLPHALAYDEPARRLYVADRLNRRVQAFTDAGDYVATYGGAKAGMGFAFGLALQQPPGRPNPLLFASTVSPAMVYVVDPATGRIIHQFQTPNAGKGPNGDLMPHDLAVAADGTIYVGESRLNTIYQYGKNLVPGG